MAFIKKLKQRHCEPKAKQSRKNGLPRRPLGLLAMTAAVLLAPLTAKAEVFVWGDADTKFTMSFPDRWRVVHNQKPDDQVTIIAPGNDEAVCRMRVHGDRRFVIYPRYLDDEVQRTNVSREFWQSYINEFDGAVLHSVTDNAGLGLGNASWADVSFITDAGPRLQKHGIMFASIYNDKAYVFECAAAEEAFGKWQHQFLSVLKSVDMRKIRHEYVNGYYRNFMGDAPLHVYGAMPEDTYIN